MADISYVNSDTAKSRNMVAVEGDALILRSAPPSNDEASRDSVRLLSPKTYGRVSGIDKVLY